MLSKLMRLLSRWVPPVPEDAWLLTESEPDGTYDEVWGSRYTHRKWVACLGEDLMKQLISDQSLDWCGCDTMGALGTMSPSGMALGAMPAISFRSDGQNYGLDAYITPFVTRADGITPLRKEGMHEQDWNRINAAFLARYADSYRHMKGPFEKARDQRLLRESQERAKTMVFPDRG